MLFDMFDVQCTLLTEITCLKMIFGILITWLLITVLLGYIVDLLPTRFFLLSESSSKPKSKYEEEEPLGSIMLEAMGQAMKKGYQVIYL